MYKAWGVSWCQIFLIIYYGIIVCSAVGVLPPLAPCSKQASQGEIKILHVRNSQLEILAWLRFGLLSWVQNSCDLSHQRVLMESLHVKIGWMLWNILYSGICFIFKYKPTLMIFLITVEHNAVMSPNPRLSTSSARF